MADEIITEAMIYHGPGSCPVCSGPLTVADAEITLMELNQDGDPITEDTTIKVRAICSHCGRKQDMMRWKGAYIPYSESSKLIKECELLDEARDRLASMNASSNKNPFI